MTKIFAADLLPLAQHVNGYPKSISHTTLLVAEALQKHPSALAILPPADVSTICAPAIYLLMPPTGRW
jgi:hypothetical protein